MAPLTDFSVRVDAGAVLTYLDALGKDAPKAISYALNRTRDEGAYTIQQGAKGAFTIRTLPLNFIAPLTVKPPIAATPENLRAILEPEGAGTILDPFEFGRPHTTDRIGRPVAVPTSALRPMKATVIDPHFYPVNLGLLPMRDPSGSLYYARGKGSKARGIAGPKPMQGKLGTFQIGNFIFQRIQGAGGAGGQGTRAGWDSHIRLLWALKPSVPRPAILHYREQAQRTVDARWAINMEGQWRAMEARHAAKAAQARQA